MKNYRYIISLIALVVGLNGCALYKEAPATNQLVADGLPSEFLIPDNWSNSDLKQSDSVATNWYNEFNNPELQGYIEEALDTTNPGVVLRIAGIDRAMAGVQLARSGRQVFMDYSAGYKGLSTDGSTSSRGNFGVPIRWEADLWGRIKAGMLAADENVLSEVHQYSFTRQSIAATVASLYFEAGILQASLELGNEFLNTNERLLEIQEIKEQVGEIDGKDVHLTKANIASINEIIKRNENLLQQVKRELEVVLGNYPENSITISWKPADLNTVVAIEDPLTLVSRRPDLLSLEAQVREAFYLGQQAELAKYPSLVLSADPQYIAGGSGFALGLGGSLLGPILNGKAIKSRIKEANAAQRQIAALYGSSILQAFQEVETTLHAEQILREQLNYAEVNASELKLAYDIAVEQYRVGQQDLYETLLLQSQYLLADLLILETQQNIYLQRIQLYLSLGGNITAKN